MRPPTTGQEATDWGAKKENVKVDHSRSNTQEMCARIHFFVVLFLRKEDKYKTV